MRKGEVEMVYAAEAAEITPRKMSKDTLSNVHALKIWCGAVVESVKRDTPDLSARQMAVLTTVYTEPAPHTVRDLAQSLNVSKPAITRALDRLSELGLIRRKPDENDRRSIFVQRTVKGSVYLTEFAELIVKASKVNMN